MYRADVLAAAMSIALTLAMTGTGIAACPSGQITCAAWCAKYRPGAQNCLAADNNSCEAKPGGRAACVGDQCNPKNDSCARLQQQEIERKRSQRP
jgi:hypothetical protein